MMNVAQSMCIRLSRCGHGIKNTDMQAVMGAPLRKRKAAAPSRHLPTLNVPALFEHVMWPRHGRMRPG